MTAQLVLATVVVACGVGILTVGVRARRRAVQVAALLVDDVASTTAGARDVWDRELAAPLGARLVRPLLSRGAAAVRRWLPAERMASVRRTLVRAGLTGRWSAEEFVALQLVSAAAGIVLAVLLVDGSPRSLALSLLVAFIGAAAPRALVDNRRTARVAEIRRELPDVIDLLAICVRAGQGLEGALRIVARREDGVIPGELRHTLREMELGVGRRAALEHLRDRLDVPDVGALVAALIQADVLGTPISDVLRTQAVEQRRRRRAEVREQAAKLPVKMLLPLTFFILPALFVVLLGPAALSIRDVFG